MPIMFSITKYILSSQSTNHHSYKLNPILIKPIKTIQQTQLMNQTQRQSKFHSKLYQKQYHKSSLPGIDPTHPTSPKYPNHFPLNNPNKLPKPQIQDSLFSAKTHLRSKDTLFIPNPYLITPNSSNQQPYSQSKFILENLSIEAQKQLMTADTVRPQSVSQVIQQDKKKTDSRGFDMWNLNKNLKQFSQTKKLPFYKHKNNPNKDMHINIDTQSKNELTNKTKTQEIRSMYKIYGGNQPKKILYSQKQRSEGHLNYNKQNQLIKKIKLGQNKEPKSYSTISNKNSNKLISPLGNTLYGTLPVRKHHSHLQTTYYKKQSRKQFESENNSIDNGINSNINPYLRTFINGSHLKRQHSNQNIHILEMNAVGIKDKSDQDNLIPKNEELKGNNFRKNRFQKIQVQKGQNKQLIQDLRKVQNQIFPNRILTPPINLSDEQQSCQNIQSNSLKHQNLSSSLPSYLQFSPGKKTQQKKKHFQYLKSIQSINKSILKKSDDYVEQYFSFNTIPNSKIQLYIQSLNHFDFNPNTTHYKSAFKGNLFQQLEMDFGFKEINETAINKQKSKKQASLAKNNKNNKINLL